MTDNEITHEIIGAAIEVHKQRGPGLFESAYEECLGPIHEAIILTHLRISGHKLGLLINLNVVLLKDGIRRFIL